MGTKTPTLEIYDFSGGMNTNSPEFLVPYNQAIELENINLLDRGFEKRRGNTAFNSSAMIDSSTPIVGMDYMKFNSGTEFLNAVAGTKFFISSSLSGTMEDKSGTVTITSGQNNFWTAVHYNDLQIWFGGAPDAPFKYSGSGNAAALGGTPPSAKTAFVANNRVFAISTSANPSILQWCILSNPEDWTGTGSGNTLVSKNDGEELLFGVPLGPDIAILFKNSSTHLVPLTSSPFPAYQLQNKIGAAGRYSWVNVNGEIYFISPSLRMYSTRDGVSFTSYPDVIDDLWDTVNSARIPYIRGIHYPALQQIHWLVSTGSNTTNNASIIWDYGNKAWLYHPTGFKANVACLVQNKRLFTGHYNGKMFEQDKASTYTDASEASPFIIDAFWRTPWMKINTLGGIVWPYFIDVAVLAETSGYLTVQYGFDFQADRRSEVIDISDTGSLWDVFEWDVDDWGGQSSVIKRIHTIGHGSNMSVRLGNQNASETFRVQGISVRFGADRTSNIKAVV